MIPLRLELADIHKSYGKRVILAGLTCSFSVGLTVITGQSGVGKSALLRILATAENASKGTLLWKGVPLPKARASLRRSLGYAPQIVDLPEDLTAREFAAYLAALKGLDRQQASKQFLDLAERMNLQADVDSRIAAFSGGMRRRLVLLQALLGQPQLLILDEPTAELDRETSRRIAQIVNDYAQSAIVITTTHAAEEFFHPRTIFSLHGGSLTGEIAQ